MACLFCFAIFIAAAKVPMLQGRAAKRRPALGGLGCSDSGLIHCICLGTELRLASTEPSDGAKPQCEHCGSGFKNKLGSCLTVSVDTSLVFSLLGETNPLACVSLHTLCGSSCLCVLSAHKQMAERERRCLR